MPSLIPCECEHVDCVCTNLMPPDEFECDDCSIGDHTFPWDEDYDDDDDYDDDWLD